MADGRSLPTPSGATTASRRAAYGGGIDELGAFQRRLHRSAARRLDDLAADPDQAAPASRELADVFGVVARRRARRAGHALDRPAAPARRSEQQAPGTVLAVTEVGPDVRLLSVVRPAGLTFAAGQYLKVGLAGQRRASFSIASAPHDDDLELCIERVPGGRLTPLLFQVGVGDRLEVTDRAKGSLRLDPSASTHLLVGTATGIAPLRSMVRDALHRGLPGRFLVLHGASHADRLAYRHELEMLAAAHGQVDYLSSVSRPDEVRSAGWTGTRGRIDEQVRSVAATLDPSSTCVYATGNSAMIASVRSLLAPLGFEVRTESFH